MGLIIHIRGGVHQEPRWHLLTLFTMSSFPSGGMAANSFGEYPIEDDYSAFEKQRKKANKRAKKAMNILKDIESKSATLNQQKQLRGFVQVADTVASGMTDFFTQVVAEAKSELHKCLSMKELAAQIYQCYLRACKPSVSRLVEDGSIFAQIRGNDSKSGGSGNISWLEVESKLREHVANNVTTPVGNSWSAQPGAPAVAANPEAAAFQEFRDSVGGLIKRVKKGQSSVRKAKARLEKNGSTSGRKVKSYYCEESDVKTMKEKIEGIQSISEADQTKVVASLATIQSVLNCCQVPPSSIKSEWDSMTEKSRRSVAYPQSFVDLACQVFSALIATKMADGLNGLDGSSKKSWDLIKAAAPKIANSKPSATFPDIPTVAELYDQDVDYSEDDEGSSSFAAAAG